MNSDISDLYDTNIDGKYLTEAKNIDTVDSLIYQSCKSKYIYEIIRYKKLMPSGFMILFNIPKIKKNYN